MEEKPSSIDPSLITLRPFTESDLDAYYMWASDDNVSRFCRWETYTNKADLLRYITTTVLSHPWFRAICLSGHPIGAIFVTPGTGGESHQAAVGYELASEHWGKGIATLVLRRVVKEVMQEMPELERLEGFVALENIASQKVLEKAGFKREGVLREYKKAKGKIWDLVVYSTLSTDICRQTDPPL